jgi:hypothetical protein
MAQFEVLSRNWPGWPYNDYEKHYEKLNQLSRLPGSSRIQTRNVIAWASWLDLILQWRGLDIKLSELIWRQHPRIYLKGIRTIRSTRTLRMHVTK